MEYIIIINFYFHFVNFGINYKTNMNFFSLIISINYIYNLGWKRCKAIPKRLKVYIRYHESRI